MDALKKFIYEYAKNMLAAIDKDSNKITGIEWDCDYCPLRDLCRESSESGDTQTCGGFIKSQLIDSKDFE